MLLDFLKTYLRPQLLVASGELEWKLRCLEDRIMLLQSGLWDEDYYVRTSGWVRRGDETPLEHYVTKGWKLGFNPSARFDGRGYAASMPDLPINPLSHYLRYGRYPLGNVKKPTNEGVEAYRQAKAARKEPAKKVVFTCVTNGYDDLNEIRCFGFTDPGWDYVCFTDDAELVAGKELGIWEIRPLQFTNLDVIRNARRHKILPHLLFPEYEESLYVDGNVNLLTPFIFQEIQRRRKDLLIPAHAVRRCLYEEFEFLKGRGVIDEELGQKQIDFYRQAGFPKNYGLHETNVLYRRHHEPEIIAMMEDWQHAIETFTQRDQMSLSYVFWKHHRKIRPYSLPNFRLENPNVCVFAHAGRSGKCPFVKD